MKRNIWKNYGEELAAKDSNGNGSFLSQFQDPDPMQVSASQTTFSLNSPCMIPLLSVPNVEEGSSKATTVLSGTARKGGMGPSVGSVDIGVSKSAYFFRVALPGVKKDPGQFNCEVERAGKVHIRGVTTTGGKTVLRHARVFEMKLQQQCPPGPFTLCFCLPGPVDPRLFFPNFRSDGILEAAVVKYE